MQTANRWGWIASERGYKRCGRKKRQSRYQKDTKNVKVWKWNTSEEKMWSVQLVRATVTWRHETKKQREKNKGYQEQSNI